MIQISHDPLVLRFPHLGVTITLPQQDERPLGLLLKAVEPGFAPPSKTFQPKRMLMNIAFVYADGGKPECWLPATEFKNPITLEVDCLLEDLLEPAQRSGSLLKLAVWDQDKDGGDWEILSDNQKYGYTLTLAASKDRATARVSIYRWPVDPHVGWGE